MSKNNRHEDYVMIRTFNSEKTLGPTLEAVFKLMPQAHIVLADDGSNDDTKGVIDTFFQTHPGQVHAFFHPHRGVSATLKSVLTDATNLVNNSSAGTVACFSCDSDDFLDEGAVEASQKIKAGADVCFLPFRYQEGYEHIWTQPVFYDWVPNYLSKKLTTFDELPESDRKTCVERMSLGYPFKALSRDILTKYTQTAVPYFPNDGVIAEDVPSILCPLFKDALLTGVTTNAYIYIRHPNSATTSEFTDNLQDREKKVTDKITFSQIPLKVYQAHSDLFGLAAFGALLSYQERRRVSIFKRTAETEPRLSPFVLRKWEEGLCGLPGKNKTRG